MSSFLDELFDMTDAHIEKCIKTPGRVMKSKHSMEKLQSDMGTFRKRDEINAGVARTFDSLDENSKAGLSHSFEIESGKGSEESVPNGNTKLTVKTQWAMSRENLFSGVSTR